MGMLAIWKVRPAKASTTPMVLQRHEVERPWGERVTVPVLVMEYDPDEQILVTGDEEGGVATWDIRQLVCGRVSLSPLLAKTSYFEKTCTH